jgi:hypothetical protein
MQRLVLVVLFLALVVAVAYILLKGALAAWRAVDEVEAGRMTANETLNKLAFALLVALILYVSVWGG